MRTATARAGGFTLIELLVALSILALLMTVSVPALHRTFRKEALRQAVSDIVEVLSNARAQAIMRGSPTEVVFHPEGRNLGVGASGAPSAGAAGGGAGTTFSQDSSEASEAQAPPMNPLQSGSGLAAQWSDRLTLEMLDVNFIEYKDAPQATVRFYPNGTCDELTVILRSDMNEYRKISLEVTTGLAGWEVIR
jgi:prepilin-type N-terminal cleavage/methylation domain-containing protein